MAAVWGNGGQAGQLPLEQWFYEMPPVTRWWTVATVATSVLVQCHILTPFQLFYSFRAVYVKSQVRGMDGGLETQLTSPTVLATSLDIPLLRSTESGSTLPRLLPSALLPSVGGVIRPILGAILMAPLLRHDPPPNHLAIPLPSIPRNRPVFQPGIHLEPTQPRNPTKLPGDTGVHGAVSAMGVDGV